MLELQEWIELHLSLITSCMCWNASAASMLTCYGTSGSSVSWNTFAQINLSTEAGNTWRVANSCNIGSQWQWESRQVRTYSRFWAGAGVQVVIQDCTAWKTGDRRKRIRDWAQTWDICSITEFKPHKLLIPAEILCLPSPYVLVTGGLWCCNHLGHMP